MATTAGRDAALADAYAALVRDGEVPTVRRMKEKASVSTDAAAAWLRVNRPDVDVPEAPAAFVTAVWPVAFAAAREGAMESLAAELDEARAHEADAQAARDAAAAQVAALTDEVAELRAQAQQADQAHQAERDRLAREMREVEARAVRAESTADAMREALDGLRADLRQAMNRTTQQAKK